MLINNGYKQATPSKNNIPSFKKNSDYPPNKKSIYTNVMEYINFYNIKFKYNLIKRKRNIPVPLFELFALALVV